MKTLLMAVVLGGLFVVEANRASALTLTNFPAADTFVRSVAANGNYGGAGSLSVSGPAATNALGQENGLFDALLRFSLAGTVSGFDSAYGAGNWTLTSTTLKLTEQAAPNNNLFNRGTGNFETRWIANDSWTEGTGQPNAPTTDGVAYMDLASLLNAANDISLGIFSNAGQNGLQSFALPLTDTAFLNDLMSGGQVGLYLTAASPGIGFTFNSRTFGTPGGRPYLELTAVAVPEPQALVISIVTLIALVGNRRRLTFQPPSAKRPVGSP